MSVLPAAMLKNLSTLSMSTSRKSTRIFRCGAVVPPALLSGPALFFDASVSRLGVSATRAPDRRFDDRLDADFESADVDLPVLDGWAAGFGALGCDFCAAGWSAV